MFVSLQRTSKSPIIYEVLDYCCGITDDSGQLLAQGNGVGGFLGTMAFAVQSTLDKFGHDGLREGDIVVTNDPYSGGGTHLSDVSLVMPIFVDGELVGFSANKAHWTEVGGKDPGSWTTDSVDIWQEGLQFPCVKLFNRGGAEPSAPRHDRGECPHAGDDARRRLGSGRLLSSRSSSLCRSSVSGMAYRQVRQAVEALLDYGEAMTARELAKLPQGVYEAEDWIDDDGISQRPDLLPGESHRHRRRVHLLISPEPPRRPAARSTARGPDSTLPCAWSSRR